jgi:hypothetical protein
MESFPPTNLFNAQRRQHKVNGTKDAVLFHQHFGQNLAEYFRHQLLRLAPYFAPFSIMLLSLKAQKIISAKATRFWCPKCWQK